MRKRLLVLFFLSMMQVVAFAQDKKITGTVTSSDGSPIPGVSVVIEGTTVGTQTGPDGKFSITAPAGKKLIFRSIGFTQKTIVVGAANEIKMSLSPQSDDLNEVVVVAYGTAKKEALNGSVVGVKSKDIEKRPVSNAIAVLEGAAGVQVNNTVGAPGSQPKVMIRGFSTVNGVNDPLYVVDGVPFGGNVTDINPADIESVNVLKDAASSALYGSRGANGVIVITTKKAKAGTSSLNFVMNQGIYTRGIKEYERLGVNDYMETEWKGYRNNLMSAQPAVYPTFDLANKTATANLISSVLGLNIYDKPADQLFDANGKLRSDARVLSGYLGDLDWYAPIERKGYRQEYSLSGASSNQKSNLYYSVGYLDEKGYIVNSDYKRFTGRINADIQATKYFKYGFNLGGSHQKTNNMNGTNADNSTGYTNPFGFARNIAPIYPVHRHDVATGDYMLNGLGEHFYDDGNITRKTNIDRHMIWENEMNKDITVRNTMNAQVYGDVKFLKNFVFTVKGDLSLRNDDNQTYENALIGDAKGKGRASITNYRYKTYTFQQLLNYNKTFGKHNVEALAGHEYYYDNTNILTGQKTMETFANKTDLVNFTEVGRLSSYQLDDRLESYLSRVRYGYNEKYFVEASARRDGTSRIAPDHRWGNFYSIGGSWMLSKEKFFEDFAGDYINYAKLRASYGEVGNTASASRYAYWTLYSMAQNNNLSAMYKNQNGAMDLKWETTASSGIALETRAFNRVNLSVEYFDRRSKDLHFYVYQPLSSGATSNSNAEATVLKNIGTVSNTGWEINTDVDVIRKNGFKWNVGANATIMKNKVVSMPPQNKDGIINGNYFITEGHGVYEFYVWKFAGVDQMTGNSLYELDAAKVPDPSKANADIAKTLVTINGKTYTKNTAYAKRVYAGNVIPKIYGSFSTGFTYKNFTLSGIFTYALGNKVYDDSYRNLMTAILAPSALHKDILKSWDGVPAGMTETSANRIDPNGIPVVDFNRSLDNNAMSTRFIQDGSYLVIKNISLSYQMPTELLRKIDMKSARFNLSVENLATFTKLQGMNPQQTFDGRSINNAPTPRIITFGLAVGL